MLCKNQKRTLNPTRGRNFQINFEMFRTDKQRDLENNLKINNIDG